MSDSKKVYGIMCKIGFGKETCVFSKHVKPLRGESDYFDIMSSGKWPNVIDYDRLWIWGIPTDYMKGGETKLSLYDRYLKAITVDANVIPLEMRVSHEGCYEPDYCFPYRSVMNKETLHILETTIGVDAIRDLWRIPDVEA